MTFLGIHALGHTLLLNPKGGRLSQSNLGRSDVEKVMVWLMLLTGKGIFSVSPSFLGATAQQFQVSGGSCDKVYEP